MKLNRRAAVAFASCFCLAPTQAATWRLSTSTDAMTDATHQSLSTSNAAGNSLVLLARQDKSVWLGFHVGGSSGPSLSARRSLVYRVDKNKARDAASFSAVAWEGRFVAIQLFDPGHPTLVSALAEVINGEKMLVRYRLSTGDLIDAEFDLNGIAEAASQLLDVAKLRETAEQQTRRTALSAECQANAVNEDYAACMRRHFP